MYSHPHMGMMIDILVHKEGLGLGIKIHIAREYTSGRLDAGSVTVQLDSTHMSDNDTKISGHIEGNRSCIV